MLQSVETAWSDSPSDYTSIIDIFMEDNIQEYRRDINDNM